VFPLAQHPLASLGPNQNTTPQFLQGPPVPPAVRSRASAVRADMAPPHVSADPADLLDDLRIAPRGMVRLHDQLGQGEEEIRIALRGDHGLVQVGQGGLGALVEGVEEAALDKHIARRRAPRRSRSVRCPPTRQATTPSSVRSYLPRVAGPSDRRAYRDRE